MKSSSINDPVALVLKPNEEFIFTVGELWTYEGRTAVICGNCISENQTIWVMDWGSGARADAPVHKLTPRQDKESIGRNELESRFTEWAREGIPDAMWWLAWWFEGVNHPKSIWYYVAALRADPVAHGWAHGRIMDDARVTTMCEGVPPPCIEFLKDIPEMQGRSIGRDWVTAVANAEKAIHIPRADKSHAGD